MKNCTMATLLVYFQFHFYFPVITEIGIYMLFSNKTPHISLRFRRPYIILGIFRATYRIPNSKRFRDSQVSISVMMFTALEIIINFFFRKDFNTSSWISHWWNSCSVYFRWNFDNLWTVPKIKSKLKSFEKHQKWIFSNWNAQTLFHQL